jgi:ABC-type branched-subunit amino acid transport system ATPase component
MLEANGLMVFYENMLALNNVSIRCDENQIVLLRKHAGPQQRQHQM